MCSSDDIEQDIVDELNLHDFGAKKRTIIAAAIEEIESLRSQIMRCHKQVTASDKSFSELNQKFIKVKTDLEFLEGAHSTALIAIETLTKQRNSLRRSYCEFQSAVVKDSKPEDFADRLGWDCFKENTND